ncbi:hypothetical protein AG1IA_04011 [Rhizoctonia solani AG-1 IA]|uniref:Uncharacterized protein n=1 Tax=Thanatephorus cucumeris (strain AG1-IA) TaxID=983506 RepID=L8WYR5_THACA|nr:hypothetical protein AG1IA_04011 [Rhizoctonia solani AG-1 IA]
MQIYVSMHGHKNTGVRTFEIESRFSMGVGDKEYPSVLLLFECLVHRKQVIVIVSCSSAGQWARPYMGPLV